VSVSSNGSDDSFIELTLETRQAKCLWKTARLERLNSGAKRFCVGAPKLQTGIGNARFSKYPAPTRALFAIIPGECLKAETRWGSEVNSNCRYRL
jgi:hypothetical protein